jgi:diguanylate cyclase (GGDEF)-like protein/PAS domain S-box-containing protein
MARLDHTQQRLPAQRGSRDPDLQFRAELVLGFALFEVLVTTLACVTELLWGSRTLGLLYAAGLVPILATLVCLLRGGRPASVGAMLLAFMFGLIAITNLATGGRSFGANIALPTLALFAVLISSRRAGLTWLALIMAQILVVASLRGSSHEFPIRPNPNWVSSAIDRVPLFFTLGSALLGWLMLRAIDRFRNKLTSAREAEAAAKLLAAAQSDRFSDFAEVAADGFWETDAKLRLRYVSPSFAHALGLSVAQMLGRTPLQAYLLRFPGALGADAFMTPLLQHRPFEGQLLATQGSDGRTRWLLNNGRPVFDGRGEFTGYRGAVRDVTEQRRAERALKHSEERLRLITDNVPAAIVHVNVERRFTFCNTTHARWLGRPVGELVGQRVADVHGADIIDQVMPELNLAFTGQRRTFEIHWGEHHFRANYVPEFDKAGAVQGVYGLVHDITHVKRIEDELRTLAQFDSLTGLANRRRFSERLADAIARCERTGQPMALMFMDLDHFKQINDTFGHKVGDLVLQEFARRIGASVRRTDTVARLAGDEFVIILEPLAALDDAAGVARKIIGAMQEPFDIDGHSHRVSASIGIAVRAHGETDGEVLLRRADAALYAVKAERRGGFHLAP